MKKLTTDAGTFGPFSALTVEADHYNGDGCVMPFTIYGQGGVIADVEPGDFVPLPPAPVVPQEITMRQARLVLLGAGLLDEVQPALEALPEPQRAAAQIEWEYAATLKRQHPLVLSLGSALGLSSEDVDALFIAAAAIT